MLISPQSVSESTAADASNEETDLEGFADIFGIVLSARFQMMVAMGVRSLVCVLQGYRLTYMYP